MKVQLPRIAINNPWVEYQVSPGTLETTAGYIYAPIEELAEANARAETLQAQLDEARDFVAALGEAQDLAANAAERYFIKCPALKEKA